MNVETLSILKSIEKEIVEDDAYRYSQYKSNKTHEDESTASELSAVFDIVDLDGTYMCIY